MEKRNTYNSGNRKFSNSYSQKNNSSRFGSGPKRWNKSNKKSFKQNIDISKFVKKSSDFVSKEKEEVKNTFSDFSFCKELNDNLKKIGFTSPTLIQDRSIPEIMKNKDLVGLANTGTGKTGAFLLPLINKVFKDQSQKVLIIAPTRELASQINKDFRQFSDYMRIFSAVCVGGMPIFKQISDLRRNPNFVIGTPGRLKDLIDRKQIRVASFNNVVVDEVDRMFDMGFIADIKEILEQLPSSKQSLAFSATLPEKIKVLIKQFLNNPAIIDIQSGYTTENVDQDIIRIKDKTAKFQELQKLLGSPEFKKVLVFSETKRDVEQLSKDLITNGFNAESIHGDKRQRERERSLRRFSENSVSILVATDVAARGLDIKDITHVINYTTPKTYDDYIHRIGRTGRGNNKGIALTFV